MFALKLCLLLLILTVLAAAMSATSHKYASLEKCCIDRCNKAGREAAFGVHYKRIPGKSVALLRSDKRKPNPPVPENWRHRYRVSYTCMCL